MERLLSNVAGIDVHKEQIVVTLLTEGKSGKEHSETFSSGTFTEELEQCAERISKSGVKDVVMESTGIYWRPVYKVFVRKGLRITLANAGKVKNVPGRKTDVKDSQWLAQLHRNGLVMASYVPEEEFQELRHLVRHRSNLVSDIGRVKNRVQKVLEDGNIKLGSVISDVFGKSGFAVCKAIAKGETDKRELSKQVDTNIQRKEDVEKALSNCLSDNHVFLMKQLVTQYLYLKQLLDEMEAELERRMDRYSDEINRLTEIPGVDKTTAWSVIAEATTDMSVFKDDRHFAAWAGVAPGNNESAGKKKEHGQGTVIPG